MVQQMIMDFLTRNWVWVALVIVIIIIIIILKNKAVQRRLNKLFGWPPAP